MKMVRKYLVCSWEGVEEGAKPEIRLVDTRELFKVLDTAKREGHKIAVFEVGERVLDWS